MKGEPVVPPVVLSSTYEFECTDDLVDVVLKRSGFIYSRWDNPTVRRAEQTIAQMEGYEDAVAFASGMCAISTAIFSLIDKGSRVVSTAEVYGGTFQLISNILPRLGIETSLITCTETDKLRQEIEKGLSLLYLETPTNPLLRVVEIEPLARLAHKRGGLVIVDSTFASPVNQRPIELGVDITIHSATKYLGGHHDITGGFVCASKELCERIWTHRKVLGGCMDPFTAYLACRGMKTLELRVTRQNESAMKLATFLSSHPKVRAVNYPGLPSHPEHHIARKQMKGFGGMLSFELDSDYEGTKRFMDSLRVIKLATSLGGVTSLATQPVTNTHIYLSPEERERVGISDSLVRLSVGIEPVPLLIEDLTRSLDKV